MSRGTALDPRSTFMQLADGVETHRTETGLIRLRGPVIKPKGPMKAFAWLIRAPKRLEVELDSIGTWVIDHLNNQRLDDLATDLAKHLKLSRREAETALADFANLLLRRHLVALTPIPGQRTTSP